MTERPRARIKSKPEDFVVEELPAYAPSGEGEHLFVRFTKRNLTTEGAVRALCDALGADPRAAGIAGLKDKVGVTTQTVSFQTPRGMTPGAFADRARGVAVDGVTVHEAIPHGNKLKPGHLLGNRFALVVRGVDPARVAEATAVLERVGREGVPNAFGAQRFGRGGDNVARALAWLRGGERAPRDPRMRRLMWSSVQSAIFNAVLDARLADGTWATPLEGDLLKRRLSGGLFLCSDVQVDRERTQSGEVSPTGPLVGLSMRPAEGAPGALERAKTEEILGEGFDFGPTRKLGEGTRRALRVWVEDLKVEQRIQETAENTGEQGVDMGVYFVLPKGAYATTVLGMAFALEETATARGASVDDGQLHPERDLIEDS